MLVLMSIGRQGVLICLDSASRQWRKRECDCYIVIREATREMAASHTRQEVRKYILDTILILSHV
jgi:hypothetical protein